MCIRDSPKTVKTWNFPAYPNILDSSPFFCFSISKSPFAIIDGLAFYNPSTCVGTLSEDRGIKALVHACYKAGVKLILGGNFSPASFGEELKNGEISKEEYDKWRYNYPAGIVK